MDRHDEALVALGVLRRRRRPPRPVRRQPARAGRVGSEPARVGVGRPPALPLESDHRPRRRRRARRDLRDVRAAAPRRAAIVDFGGGRYVDRFERRAGDWRIAARVVVMDWVCDAGAEDPRGVLDRYVRGRWDREDVSYARPLVVGGAVGVRGAADGAPVRRAPVRAVVPA